MPASNVKLIVNQIGTWNELRDEVQTVGPTGARRALDLIARHQAFSCHRLRVDRVLPRCGHRDGFSYGADVQ